MVTDDILLLKLIQAKDEQAFKFLFDTYFVPLCRYVHLYLDSTQEGEELVLDILMYVWEHSSQINLTLSLKAYLFQAARNRCLNFLRDRKQTFSLDFASDVSSNGSSRSVKVYMYLSFNPSSKLISTPYHLDRKRQTFPNDSLDISSLSFVHNLSKSTSPAATFKRLFFLS
ncbi:MAG: hypothetical protein K2L60_11135 [Bacteroides sp.]|nr:hypothetical protein [Bacteroides sp.]